MYKLPPADVDYSRQLENPTVLKIIDRIVSYLIAFGANDGVVAIACALTKQITPSHSEPNIRFADEDSTYEAKGDPS